MVDTSLIYFAVNHLDCAGGVMVTASHNPPQYNGFKVSKRKAKPVGEATGLADIRKHAAMVDKATLQPAKGRVEQRDLWAAYAKHVRAVPRHPWGKKLKVVIDASNGMAGTMIPKIFGKTGSPRGRAGPRDHRTQLRQHQGRLRARAQPARRRQSEASCRKPSSRRRPTSASATTATPIAAWSWTRRATSSAAITSPPHGPSTSSQNPRARHRVRPALDQGRRRGHRQGRRGQAGARPRRARLHEGRPWPSTRRVFGGELSGHFYFRDNFNADSGAIAMASCSRSSPRAARR
jgi:phosphomannomutase